MGKMSLVKVSSENEWEWNEVRENVCSAVQSDKPSSIGRTPPTRSVVILADGMRFN